MTQQFKKTAPLQTLLRLIGLTASTLLFAQTRAEPTSQPLADENQQKAQQFYQQFYLTPQQIANSDRQDVQPSALCSGTWVTPISQQEKTVSDPTQVESSITADSAYYNPHGISLLQGNVTIEQQGRKIRADKIELDETQTIAQAQGKVQLAQGGIFAQSENITYNLKTQTGDLRESYYISEQQQAHGYAAQIKRTSPDVVVLENASYSTCSPNVKPNWHIQAKTIELNQITGRGITKDARLYIKDVPILPVPYFNFPIDDRRTTGFLTPSFGYTNDGGVQLSIPYYFNLAPHYDLTATPRYLGERGLMLEGDFRYLTPFGHGEIWGGYLPEDQHYNHKDRQDIHWKHHWQINQQFQALADINYVSDKDYFTDLGTSPTSQDQIHQQRTWTLNYSNGIEGLNAQLRIQDFQTLDQSIQDVDRPYARLPQFLLNYQGGKFDGLEYRFLNDTAYFKKSITDRSAIESSGTRIYNQVAARYNYRTPSLFIIPEISARSINTFFDEDSKISQGFDKDKFVEKSVAVPQFTLDSGLTFERSGKYLQTLSPRLFYAFSPYQNQTDYPNFDSTAASISYDQLFSPYRFYGHDRLEDNHFTSLGLTYRLYDRVGLERVKASIGQSFFFADRKVRLHADDLIAKDNNTGPVLMLSSQLSNTFYVTGNAAWLANGQNAQNNLLANYTDDKGRIYNLGYFYRKNVNDQRQQAYQQVATSFVQPINENWRILGHVQYDLNHHLTREWLTGLNYESCCWNVSVYARSYYNDLDDLKDPNTSAKRAIMAEFSLKGLGGLSGKLASLLKDRVIGFEDINQTWIQR